jgi:hypothetical protein
MMSFVRTVVAAGGAILLSPVTSAGQQHQHPPATTPPSSWHLMQDGVVFTTYNDQGGSRGGEDFSVQNWWMGMAQRQTSAGTLRFNLMLSLEPATLGDDGYREIFQAGETLDGRPLIDRQHPHDFLMQAAVVWSTPLPRGFTLTLAGAPVGEPALGPVAFMHRASAAENPTAPLSHHTFDSTHIAMGVLTASLEHGPWQVETSIFHGQEPDENRWDLMDPGPLDSWSVRGWYRPNDRWSFQVSHGFLTDPERLDPGNIHRTLASATWIAHHSSSTMTAATVAYGRRNHPGADFNAVLAEATHTRGGLAVYGRYENLQVESDLLRFGTHIFGGVGNDAHVPEGVGGVDWVAATTVGASHRVAELWGWDVAAGGDVTWYGVPEVLEPLYTESPVSFHVFLRIRPPAKMRMWETTMTKTNH